MADNTKISWTDATVNFWWGCTKVGPGCDWCYAETWSERFGGGIWGAGVPRRKIKSAVKLLHKLDNDYSWWAADCHIGRLHDNSRRRVFIQSMSDLFDKEVPLEWFAEAWTTISRCSRIEVQIVTKRVSYVEKRLADIGVTTWPKHVGLMISVVNQDEANRDILRLIQLKNKLGIPWVGLSMEPLLGPVDLEYPEGVWPEGPPLCCSGQECGCMGRPVEPPLTYGLDWVIVGMESGGNARHQPDSHAQAIVNTCIGAGVPVFVKQLSSGKAKPITDIEQFPEGLRVRQFPRTEQNDFTA